jgi:hypothetical protein
MAGQDLGLNIKTTSDVPQAMDKAKAAAGSFSKQAEDIGMKFKNSFKDIFLGFTAPMVILQSLIGSISNAIENSKRQAQEGFDLIAKGDTIYASSEEKRFAAYLKARKAMEDEQAAVKKGKVEVTQKFVDTPEGGKLGIQLAQEAGVAPEGMSAFFGNLANNPEFQKRALEWFLNSPEAKKFETPGEADKKAGSFKGPEGFGAVVGVGANPVLEKMTRQNEIMEEIKLILQEQSIQNRGGSVPNPFTERVPLTLQKIGAV